jgi:hypothetical protein
MTKRRRTATPRVQSKRMPWADPFPRLFRLPEGWSPPADVLIRMGPRTWSYVADFTADTGETWRHTIRIDPFQKSVLGEELTARFIFKGKKP